LPSTLENSPCISGSTIWWPNQLKPTPTAWKHWTNAIRALYLRTDSNKLKQLLRIWYQSTVNQDWQWTWRINPNTHVLYHWTGTEWTGRRPEVTRQTYIEYRALRRGHATHNPEHFPPVTPHIDLKRNIITVHLPILPVKDTISAPLLPPEDLLERLMTPPETWALPLWHRIRPHTPVKAILHHLQQQQHLIICSDAGVDSAKYSSCAWTIYGSEVLWQGKGIVPGNHDDTYSGRSEAFGILTALMFLSHYLHHYPHPIEPQRHLLMVYCDNGRVVTQATKYSKATIIYLTLLPLMTTMCSKKLNMLFRHCNSLQSCSSTLKDTRINIRNRIWCYQHAST